MSRLLGLDLYAGDGNGPNPSFPRARMAGARFLVAKAAQYLSQDTLYATYADAARAAGLVVGAYFFPGWSHVAASPAAQVAFWKKNTPDIVPSTDFPPCLDVESGNWSSTGHSFSEIVALFEIFVREMQDAFGCNPMIYTSYNIYASLGYPSLGFVKECPLYVKTAYRLNPRQPPDQVEAPAPHVGPSVTDPRDYYRIPPPWSSGLTAIRQFQGDALGFPGLAGTTDLNEFLVTDAGAAPPGAEVWLRKNLKTSSTGAALKTDLVTYQASVGLTADGLVGPVTFARLGWL